METLCGDPAFASDTCKNSSYEAIGFVTEAQTFHVRVEAREAVRKLQLPVLPPRHTGNKGTQQWAELPWKPSGVRQELREIPSFQQLLMECVLFTDHAQEKRYLRDCFAIFSASL